jgi:hypothetical protein
MNIKNLYYLHHISTASVRGAQHLYVGRYIQSERDHVGICKNVEEKRGNINAYQHAPV